MNEVCPEISEWVQGKIHKPVLDDTDEPHLSCNYSNWSTTIAHRRIMWIKRYSRLEFRKGVSKSSSLTNNTESKVRSPCQ